MKQIIIAAIAISMMMVTLVSAKPNEGLETDDRQESEFIVRNSAVASDGSLSSQFTGDGPGMSMPVEWSNVPTGTKYFALNLWHIPKPISDPDQVKSYWLVYNIPSDIRSLPAGVKGVGIDGYNSKNKTGYDPMSSKGPGVKEYNLTLYALSAKPVFKNTTRVQRSDLLQAIKGILLDECTLKYTYERVNNDRQESRKKKLEALTAPQKENVKNILRSYDPVSLTAKDARAIHEAFRKAGLRGGPAAADAIREAGFDPDKLRDLAPPPDGDRDKGKDKQGQGPDKSSGQYSIEQAISDRAQLTTMAFSGLAFITGDFGASTFIPPGKVCDYFGFQYMRDVDIAKKGHNPMFVDRVVGNVLSVLNDKQKQLFRNLAEEQVPQLETLAKMRLPLIKSFHKKLDGNIPNGSNGLNKQAVINYVGDIFAQDAKLSIRRAEVMSAVAASLTDDQKSYLGEMKFGDFNSWPDKTEKAHLERGKSKLFNVAYMTYASEFFSWYAGSVEADTYICPERQGTYFGGFYMKDIPAMNKKDYDISTSITGDKGEAFLNDVLNDRQRVSIIVILDKQCKLLEEIIDVRRAFSTELRKLLAGKQLNKKKLIDLGYRYGELDGELSWNYAMTFAGVNRTLTDEQRLALVKLRNLEGYKSAPYYLYSSPVEKLPEMPAADRFFFAPKQQPKVKHD
ncbi:MAG: YbhB/YbcL family Raf kinase inhibitor-like protein [Desulfobacula sp.]|jgi:phosphatidylethanolamine-binding protein (PEBP) family uncharacterized protein|nr:YbhB/YbcL family Raf kinase inhibitor-like protein [Desulfobacula sp.]